MYPGGNPYFNSQGGYRPPYSQGSVPPHRPPQTTSSHPHLQQHAYQTPRQHQVPAGASMTQQFAQHAQSPHFPPRPVYGASMSGSSHLLHSQTSSSRVLVSSQTSQRGGSNPPTPTHHNAPPSFPPTPRGNPQVQTQPSFPLRAGSFQHPPQHPHPHAPNTQNRPYGSHPAQHPSTSVSSQPAKASTPTSTGANAASVLSNSKPSVSAPKTTSAPPAQPKKTAAAPASPKSSQHTQAAALLRERMANSKPMPRDPVGASKNALPGQSSKAAPTQPSRGGQSPKHAAPSTSPKQKPSSPTFSPRSATPSSPKTTPANRFGSVKTGAGAPNQSTSTAPQQKQQPSVHAPLPPAPKSPPKKSAPGPPPPQASAKTSGSHPASRQPPLPTGGGRKAAPPPASAAKKGGPPPPKANSTPLSTAKTASGAKAEGKGKGPSTVAPPPARFRPLGAKAAAGLPNRPSGPVTKAPAVAAGGPSAGRAPAFSKTGTFGKKAVSAAGVAAASGTGAGGRDAKSALEAEGVEEAEEEGDPAGAAAEGDGQEEEEEEEYDADADADADAEEEEGEYDADADADADAEEEEGEYDAAADADADAEEEEGEWDEDADADADAEEEEGEWDEDADADADAEGEEGEYDADADADADAEEEEGEYDADADADADAEEEEGEYDADADADADAEEEEGEWDEDADADADAEEDEGEWDEDADADADAEEEEGEWDEDAEEEEGEYDADADGWDDLGEEDIEEIQGVMEAEEEAEAKRKKEQRKKVSADAKAGKAAPPSKNRDTHVSVESRGSQGDPWAWMASVPPEKGKEKKDQKPNKPKLKAGHSKTSSDGMNEKQKQKKQLTVQKNAYPNSAPMSDESEGQSQAGSPTPAPGAVSSSRGDANPSASTKVAPLADIGRPPSYNFGVEPPRYSEEPPDERRSKSKSKSKTAAPARPPSPPYQLTANAPPIPPPPQHAESIVGPTDLHLRPHPHLSSGQEAGLAPLASHPPPPAPPSNLPPFPPPTGVSPQESAGLKPKPPKGKGKGKGGKRKSKREQGLQPDVRAHANEDAAQALREQAKIAETYALDTQTLLARFGPPPRAPAPPTYPLTAPMTARPGYPSGGGGGGDGGFTPRHTEWKAELDDLIGRGVDPMKAFELAYYSHLYKANGGSVASAASPSFAAATSPSRQLPPMLQSFSPPSRSHMSRAGFPPMPLTAREPPRAPPTGLLIRGGGLLREEGDSPLTHSPSLSGRRRVSEELPATTRFEHYSSTSPNFAPVQQPNQNVPPVGLSVTPRISFSPSPSPGLDDTAVGGGGRGGVSPLATALLPGSPEHLLGESELPGTSLQVASQEALWPGAPGHGVPERERAVSGGSVGLLHDEVPVGGGSGDHPHSPARSPSGWGGKGSSAAMGLKQSSALSPQSHLGGGRSSFGSGHGEVLPGPSALLQSAGVTLSPGGEMSGASLGGGEGEDLTGGSPPMHPGGIARQSTGAAASPPLHPSALMPRGSKEFDEKVIKPSDKDLDTLIREQASLMGPPSEKREECPTCNRKFAASRLARHLQACREHAEKAAKRPGPLYFNPQKGGAVHDSPTRRPTGDLTRVTARISGGGSTGTDGMGGDGKDQNPPQGLNDSFGFSLYTPCPHCKQPFAPAVLQTHVENCVASARQGGSGGKPSPGAKRGSYHPSGAVTHRDSAGSPDRSPLDLKSPLTHRPGGDSGGGGAPVLPARFTPDGKNRRVTLDAEEAVRRGSGEGVEKVERIQTGASNASSGITLRKRLQRPRGTVKEVKEKIANLEQELASKIKKGDIYQRASHYASTQCPHCRKNFSKKAAERHIGLCETLREREKHRKESISCRDSVVAVQQYLLHGIPIPAGQQIPGMPPSGSPPLSTRNSFLHKTPHGGFMSARTGGKQGDPQGLLAGLRSPRASVIKSGHPPTAPTTGPRASRVPGTAGEARQPQQLLQKHDSHASEGAAPLTGDDHSARAPIHSSASLGASEITGAAPGAGGKAAAAPGQGGVQQQDPQKNRQLSSSQVSSRPTAQRSEKPPRGKPKAKTARAAVPEQEQTAAKSPVPALKLDQIQQEHRSLSNTFQDQPEQPKRLPQASASTSKVPNHAVGAASGGESSRRASGDSAAHVTPRKQASLHSSYSGPPKGHSSAPLNSSNERPQRKGTSRQDSAPSASALASGGSHSQIVGAPAPAPAASTEQQIMPVAAGRSASVSLPPGVEGMDRAHGVTAERGGGEAAPVLGQSQSGGVQAHTLSAGSPSPSSRGLLRGMSQEDTGGRGKGSG
uniref:C2HC/C3H-type domain-containing protein n=1 Tax=Chromera velia CCMP2878 TaxID=1169474 RepID=A0A0G4I0W3_9ALVE|eukprot:Cvel_10042.t1-p1 / transcript=Cvel_10042.t1 / gene=Cvel_10042 / organism=Chromera_velia_CCMP2878 / gene_product=hypothetical protein / transcript_product=hypothetical protein / location=Cvel_scaffold597:39451-47878(+) / protein_length=2272 / sequence_SO=supercontig / SO=protein_coding / is_pseudo=false